MTADEIKKMEEWCDWACANKERTSKVWKALRLGYIRGVYETEQKLNIHSVVRGGVIEVQSLPLRQEDLEWVNSCVTQITPTEPLKSEGVGKSVCGENPAHNWMQLINDDIKCTECGMLLRA